MSLWLFSSRLAVVLGAALTLFTGVAILAGKALRANAPELVYALSVPAERPRWLLMQFDLERRAALPLAGANAVPSAFSRDGDWLVYTRDTLLCMLQVATQREQCPSTHPLIPFESALSPDGRWLIFSAIAFQRNEEVLLYQMRLDGSEMMAVTDALTINRSPAWSPDGTQIAFVRWRRITSSIYTMQPDGSGLRQITRLTGEAHSPTWSPDGTQIAFFARQGRSNRLAIIERDGRNLRYVLRVSTDTYGLSWSPDGAWLAFSARLDGSADLYLVRPDGSDLTRLTDDPANEVAPVWRP